MIDNIINKKDRKNLFWNMLGSLTIGFTSLIFMIIITRINGVKDAGVYTFAFAVSCILLTIGSYSGKVYQVTETDKNITDHDYLYNRIITVIIMQVIALLFCALSKCGLYKSLIIMALSFYRGVDALTEASHAITQRNGDLYKTGMSMFYKTIVLILNFLIVDLITKSLLITCISMAIVSFIIYYFVDYKTAIKYTKKTAFNKVNNKQLLKRGLIIFIGTFLATYILNCSKYAIEIFCTDEIQAIFGIIILPASFLSMISTYVVQPFLNEITECISTCNNQGLIKLIMKICIAILFIGIIAIVCAYLLGIPLLELIYGIPLKNQLGNLIIILVGSIFYSFSIIMSAIVIAYRKIWHQLFIFLIDAIFSIILGFFLVKNFMLLGASLLYLLVMLIQFVLYTIVLYIIMKQNKKYNGNEMLK